MRAAIVALLLALAPAALAQGEEAGSVSGRVTVAGRPAARVAVELVTSAAGAPHGGERGVAGRAVTDDDGRYTIEGVAPGRYEVWAASPKYVEPGRGPRVRHEWSSGDGPSDRAVTVGPGERAAAPDVVLVPGGVITGRVVDASGRPLVGGQVQLFRRDDDGNVRPVFEIGGPWFSTDDRGVYRFYGLEAGTYTVSAGGDISDGAVPGPSYDLTFHPAAARVEDAELVTVEAGSEARDVDILLKAPARKFSASGRVVDAETGRPVPGVELEHGVFTDTSSGWSSGDARTNARGEFRLDGLTPGRHAVKLSSQVPGTVVADMVRFEVTDADVKGLVLTLRPGATVEGRLETAGAKGPPYGMRVSAQLVAHEDNGLDMHDGRHAEPAADGTFRIVGLRPGRYRLGLGSPGGVRAAIVSVTRGGADISEGLDVGDGETVGGVRIVLRLGTGRLEGQVALDDGAELRDVKLDAQAWRRGPRGDSWHDGDAAPVDARGRFALEALIPGEYVIRVVGSVGGARVTGAQPVMVGETGAAEVIVTLKPLPREGPR